jgi:hypothetical protein
MEATHMRLRLLVWVLGFRTAAIRVLALGPEIALAVSSQAARRTNSSPSSLEKRKITGSFAIE